MKIGLYGIDGLYNYGCEAIVRGTEIMLHRLNPSFEIIYYSRRAEQDCKAIADIPVKIENINRKLTVFQRLINKFSRIFIGYNIFSDYNYKKVCQECDVIISIGGDIYTIPKYQQNKNIKRISLEIVRFGEYVKKHKRTLIIYGASIGPFGSQKKIVDYFKRHLEKVDLILCREEKSIEYLKTIGIYKNVELFPDPAFGVEGKFEVKLADKEYVGVNLSALSLKEIYGEVSTESEKKLAGLIDALAIETKKKVMLIPHVFSPGNSIDNDYLFLEKIQKMLKTESVLVKQQAGFIGLKKELQKCSFVVAARMHCCVNAVCEEIPTIFLAYSQKAEGMVRFVYGSDKWLILLENIEDQLINLGKAILEDRETINKNLEKKIQEIRIYQNFENEKQRIIDVIEKR